MSKLEKIQIGIPCGRNSEKYARFLCDSIERTISKNREYEIIIGINQSGVNKSELSQIKNSRIVTEIHNRDSSVGHGRCLDLILRNMNTRYGILVDSDVAFLAQNWDQKLLSYLDDKTIMIGSEYHPTDGKIVDFPNVISCAIDVERFKSLEISFIPSLNVLKASEKNASWFGVSVGQEIFLDTGCHLPEKIGPAGLKWKTMKIITPRYEDRIGLMKFMEKNTYMTRTYTCRLTLFYLTYLEGEKIL